MKESLNPRDYNVADFSSDSIEHVANLGIFGHSLLESEECDKFTICFYGD